MLEHAVAVDQEFDVRIGFERSVDGIDIQEREQPGVDLGVITADKVTYAQNTVAEW